MTNNIFKKYLPAACILGCLGFMAVSCTEAIEIGEVDESQYANVGVLNGYLRDAGTGKSENVIELRADDYRTDIVFGLTKTPGKGVDVTLSYDADYAQTYNALHQTDYPLYPQELVEIEDNGRLVLAPDEKTSYELGIDISYSDRLEDDRTYILPVKASSETEGVSIAESASHSVYLIKNYHSQSSAFKGDDAVKTFLFFEVNDTNPLNALEFVLDNEEGSLFFDYVVLFAANINYNAETGRVYVYCNPNVQFLLDHSEEYLQPLRKRGIKVLLGLLGNHDAAGLAQLSEAGAKDFARELAAICEAYNLDGVNFDDEYSDSPDLNNPLFAPKSTAAAARLCYETKKVMPDKDVTVFAYGYMYGTNVVDGVDASEWIDIVVPNYGSSARPIGNLTVKQCAGFAAELNLMQYQASESSAQRVVSGGYGYYMLFALYASDAATTNVTKRVSQVTSCSNVCRGLYGVPLKEVSYYYPKNSTEKVDINWISE